MRQRSEIADRLDAESALKNFPDSRAAFRRGDTGLDLGFGREGNALAKAVLAVIDEWEEVEVRPSTCSTGTLFVKGSSHYVAHDDTCFTILRRKQKPKPDVTELARRAVKEWKRRFGEPPTRPLSIAMTALAEAVDEQGAMMPEERSTT